MRLLERFTWLHVLIISLIGAGLVGAIVHFTRPGAFTATSSLLLSDRPDIVAGIAGDSSAADSGPSLERLQAILVSRALRERVAEKVKLAETLNARRVDAVEMLLHNTTVKAIGEDGLTMTVTTHGYARPGFAMLGYPVTFARARQLSAEIANAYVSELREYLRDVSLQHAADTVSFLRTRRDELQGELSETEDRLQTLRAQYELLDPDNEATRLGERIRALEQARAEAAAEADASASSMKEAESQLAEADARRIASAVEARNPVISRLEEELTQHRIDLAAELARGKTCQNRDVVQIQSAIDSIEAQLAGLEDTVVQQLSEQPNPLHDDAVQRVVDLRVQLAGARARKAETEALLAAARGRMAELPAVAREYMQIQRLRQVQSGELTSVEQALWKAEIEEERARSAEQFSVLDEATPPSERAGPATALSAGIAFVALMLLQGLFIIDRRWFGG